MSQNEENEIRSAADAEFEMLMEKHVKPLVPPAVYTQLMGGANGVARAHYGRGFLEGGRASWYTA
jgi:hypothetical protein